MNNNKNNLHWDKFLVEGDILYNYMLNNFENMFDGDSKIKHFDIVCGLFALTEYIDEIKEQYNDDIQKELILWIKKELEENRLFQKDSWKPFRDPDLIIYMFFGYRKMFQYKNYYFQLSLSTDCEYNDECEYCKNKENTRHFGLAFYGWKDINKEKLQPDNLLFVPSDNIIPESFWRRE
jgi:hypothetical protein